MNCLAILVAAALLLAAMIADAKSIVNKRNTAEQRRTRTPTLLISMDGFRADKLDEFLKNHPDSFLQREFVERGVKAEYMLPSFPTLTFPNVKLLTKDSFILFRALTCLYLFVNLRSNL